MSFKPISLIKEPNKRRGLYIILAVLGVVVVAGGYLAYRYLDTPNSRRWQTYRAYLQNRGDYEDILLRPGMRCDGAPFAFPTTGVIFGLWNQPYRPGHLHAGLDIFSGAEPGVTPVYAAYPGYLTRKADWIATVIIRIPSDPLDPGRQIWTYYTHMADVSGETSFVSEVFPPGTEEVFVEAGTLLGYQGNYSGSPDNPTGLHLHFSVVKDDGAGSFLNELEIENTYDPTPYLNLPVNNAEHPDEFPTCAGEVTYENWNLVNGDE